MKMRSVVILVVVVSLALLFLLMPRFPKDRNIKNNENKVPGPELYFISGGRVIAYDRAGMSPSSGAQGSAAQGAAAKVWSKEVFNIDAFNAFFQEQNFSFSTAL